MASPLVQEEIRRIGSNYPMQNLIRIDLQDLERFDSELADLIYLDPDSYIQKIKEELEPIILTPKGPPHLNVGFINIPVESSPKITTISERDIGKLMRVEGQVASAGTIYPKMMVAYYKCNRCDEDAFTSQGGFQPAGVEVKPPRCLGCGKDDFRLITTHSEYTTAQVLLLTEKPESLRAGQQPPMVSIYLTGELCFKKIDVMERLAVDGRLEIVHTGKKTDQKYVWYLNAHNVDKQIKSFEELDMTAEEKLQIIEMSKSPTILQDIVDSFAVTIYGHTDLKIALILQLAGGTDQPNEDGKRRYWINILALTDPGIGKSVLCKALTNIAPKAMYVVGSSATRGGLTSIADKDPINGEWMIRPGALPLCHGGVCAIDEFTDMDPEEMNALKEGMEQGEVTTTKAAKNVKFKAETAIFACANPMEGRFDNFKNPLLQTGVPAPVLSRFDLIFPLKDTVDLDKDTALAKDILNLHKGKGRKANITRDLLRKYIGYAKKNITPIITEECSSMLQDYFTDLRTKGQAAGIISITPRQLESLIRLAEASAKIRLSPEAGVDDAKLAIRLMEACMKEIAYDQATGLPDTQTITMGGADRSKREKMKLIVEKIVELEAIMDPVSFDAIQESLNMKPGELADDLAKLKDVREIYEPKFGFYKKV